MTKTEIKAIRSFCGYTADLRVKLPEHFVSPIADWLEKNLVEVFGYSIFSDLNITCTDYSYAGGIWARESQTDEFVLMGWKDHAVVRDFCETQARMVACGESTEKSAIQLSYRSFGKLLNPGGSDAQGHVLYRMVRDPETLRYTRVDIDFLEDD